MPDYRKHMNEEVARRLDAEEETMDRPDTIPEVGRRVAEQLLAEIGTDMSRFPTAAHLASWARLCPGNNQSAGKRMSGWTGHGSPWLRGILVEAVQAAARSKNTYLAAKYQRLVARRGHKRAIVALAQLILLIAYHLLRDGTTYQELVADYLDKSREQAVLRRSIQRIQHLGFKLSIQAA